MKRLGLTQAALNLAAKQPGGKEYLRQKRAEVIAHRDREQREHEQHMAEASAIIERIGIALGEVEA